MHGGKDKETQSLFAAGLEAALTQQEVDRLAPIDVGLLNLALLAVVQRLVEQAQTISEQDATIAQLKARLQGAAQPAPSTPSGKGA